MNNRDIAGFVRRAGRRLKSVHISQSLQKALLIGLTAAVLLLFLSRLFMLPYYEFYAYAAGALAILAWLLISMRNLPDQHQAVTELDRFTPHNQLLTAWQTEDASELAMALTNKTAEMLPHSYLLFKQEPRQWLLGKWLLASLASGVILSLLLLFPSTLQQEAQDTEKELDLITQIEKEVAKIEKEAKSEPLKKEMKELQGKVAESKKAEEALKEVVKKQKELALQKQQLAESKGEAAKQESKERGKASDKLAEQAGKTQTALSNMGKPVNLPLQRTIANSDPAKANNAETQSSQGSSSSAASGTGENAAASSGQSGAGQGKGKSEGPGEGEGQGKGEGQGQGKGEGNGQGQGQGQGNGQGQGQGNGQGNGQGGGQGAGTGQGNRELLTVPSRIGGTGETEVDNGELGEGEAADEQEAVVPAERGEVRPYSDVVGQYSESYFSSAEKMELPPDLQKVVEQYFSSIDSEQ